MSIEEKIETLQSIMNDACTLCDDYFGPDPDCDEHCIRLNTINEASTALRKAEKYKWHDLRKNPGDLPLLGEEIEVFTIDHDYRILKFTHHSKYIVAWKHRESFEVEE